MSGRINRLTTAPIKPIVLCGGSGTRLWPISRRSFPKQFVPLIEGKSLLQSTFERVLPYAQTEEALAVSSAEYRFFVRDAAEKAGVKSRIILEPIGRNTAPAMAAAALNSNPEDLLLFLPADHYVPDASLFLDTLQKGISAAQEGAIVVFGVTPTQPHTGYGYIQIQPTSLPVKNVSRFIEKPSQKDALSYIAAGHYYWNAGIFLVRADILLSAIRDHAKDIFDLMQMAVNNQRVEHDFIYLDQEPFEKCRSESIDYAVLERHPKISMVPFEGLWSDVGSWNALADLSSADEEQNQISGNGRVYSARSTYIYASRRPVVALGTDELLIVDTDDALLVAKKSHAEKTKDLVADLLSNNVPQATEHRFSCRPWGQFDTIDEGDGFKVKRLTLKPGASISLQLHHHRAEHWIVVKGTARVTRGNEVFLLSQNESTFIAVGVKHRLENPGTSALELIEVQSGAYLGEDDIVRFDDEYGRSN